MPRVKLALAAAVFLAGCGANESTMSSRQVEDNIAASCRAAEARAKAAANPTPAMVAFHDRLQKKTDDLQKALIRGDIHGAELQAALGKVAQAQVEADAVYDVKGKLEVTSSYWNGLKMTREMHQEMQERLSQIAGEESTPRSFSQPFPSVGTISSPPEPPTSHPVGLNAPTAPPKTWLDTPYAPMIPPALRDQPISNETPAIPPVAR